MARLALDRAPTPDLPKRFLLTAPLWGMVAGALLLIDGDAALLSRWAPATLALVHAFTLGVLGNAMFGSLLQFLPVAAGVRVHGGPVAARCLHGLLNIGVVALLVGFRGPRPGWLMFAGGCLVATFALLAAMTLPGLLAACAQRLLRIGIALAVVAGLATAVLGGAMVLGLAGVVDGWALVPWANIHAGWGVVGWILVLLASVAQVVMPMFQGTTAGRPVAQATWLALAAGGLLLGAFCAVRGHELALRGVAVACAAVFALAALARQWSARSTRNAWLVHSWRAGLLAVLAAAAMLAAGAPSMLVGALAIGIGLPLLVGGMQLEIVPFLGWIELQREPRRGVRVPSVQSLLPDVDKRRVLFAQLLAAALLLVAVSWPQAAMARIAGLALILAHGMHALALLGVGRRVAEFRANAVASAVVVPGGSDARPG